MRELQVCPALTDEQFLITIKQLSNDLVRGSAGSFLLDRGENFVQTRAYQQGDATSSIDWKASARSKELVVKEHESLRQTVVTLVVDRSGSMTAGSQGVSKYAAACILSGGLAYAALKTGSPVGFVLSEARPHATATLSSAHVSAALLQMRRFPLRERTPLSRCLTEGFLRATRRQLIFVLSDFHDPCARAGLALLAERHEVVLVRLRDAVEERTPSSGTLCLQPSEGGPARYVRRQCPLPGGMDADIASLGLASVTIDPGQPVSSQLHCFLALHKKIA